MKFLILKGCGGFLEVEIRKSKYLKRILIQPDVRNNNTLAFKNGSLFYSQ